MFTWNESVGLSIIKYIYDPELVMYFLNIAIQIRREYIDNNSMKYHSKRAFCSGSLSIFKSRWNSIELLRKNQKFTEHYEIVSAWKKYMILLKSIRCYQDNTIDELLQKINSPVPYIQDENIWEKIKIVNSIVNSIDNSIVNSIDNSIDNI
jgi:hypothetical protein